MAGQLPVQLDKDLNRSKNKKISDDIIPHVYQTIIEIGCQKGKDESFIDYYNRRPEKLWNDNKKKWESEVDREVEKRAKHWPLQNKIKEKERCLNKLKEDNLKKLLIKESWSDEEKIKLAQTSCYGMDATILHKLAPTICDGIGKYDPNAPSSTQIEIYLRQIKNIRNDICHDPKGAAISGNILDKFEESAVNALEAAGRLYSSTLDQQTVPNKIAELKKMLKTTREEVMTDDQHRILQTAKKLSVDGMAEMKNDVGKQAADYLPHSDDTVTRSDIYHDITLQMTVEKEDAKSPDDQTTVEFPSTEILQKGDGDVILCEGEAGSGKTTFLRRLREDYFSTGNKKFCGLDFYELILYMDCRDTSITTLSQLLKRLFPKTMNQLNDKEALQALNEMKLLICVDGLDELNKSSRKLLDELIRTFQSSGNVTFVCTSRPGQSHYLRSVRYKTMSLQPITKEKEKVTFLERYQENIKGIEAPELIQAFKALVQSCKDCLRQPIYLALFCYLFRKFGQEVCRWKNEASIMEHILTLSEKTMIDRMKTMDIENREDYADNVTKAIKRISVGLLRKGEVLIDKETYKNLRQEIFDSDKVSHYSILSSYFTRHSDGRSMNFYHKSYLEFLAAKFLYEFLVSNPSSSIIAAIMSAEQAEEEMR